MPDQKYFPPKAAQRFFRWYCRHDRVEELEGDLLEFFYLRVESGDKVWKARLYFWWNVFRCYRPYAKSKTQTSATMLPLFKSYLKLAIRHSWKNKWSVLVNVIGLGLALSMCIFVYTIYAYNLEFDSFYKDTYDVYRVNAMTFENGRERRNELSPIQFEYKLRNEVGGITQVSSFFSDRMTIKDGVDYFDQYVGVVSSDFFEMFDIPLWYGSLAEFGNQPVVYLTRPTAKRFFGDEVALGKKLAIYVTNDQKLEVTVGGVFERIPLNSSFDINIMMSLDDYVRATEVDINNWSSRMYTSHFIRAEAGQVEGITKGLNEYISLQNENHESFKMVRFELLPFRSKLHNDDEMRRNNSNTRLTASVHIIFTILASMVFLIACFNLANTSMAMIAKRLKEIGIRKTLGSENKQILGQYLLEMGIICILAFIIGLSMINLTSNSIMGLFGETFLIRDVNLTGVILFIIGFLVFTTLVSGLIPALYAWKFQPVAIMRKSVRLKGVGWLNKILTVFQYSFSIAVLSAGITFSHNADFLEEFSPGYNNKEIYMLNLGDSQYFKSMKQLADQIPGISTVGTRNHLANFGRSSRRRVLEIDTSSYELRTYSLGAGYLELMEVPIVMGRSFNEGSEVDRTSVVLVNQEFAKQYFDNENPVNQVVKIEGERRTIIGVFADIIDNVYEDSETLPTAFFLDKEDELPYLIAKVNHGNSEEVEEEFKAIWSQIIDRPYDGDWQKNITYGSAVRDTYNLKVIFLSMAILGGFLSIVGIFSLAKLNVAKRLKEISIRKVLGSTISDLLMTINRPFFLVLVISMVIGAGLGFFVSDMTLGFVYRYYVGVSALTSLFSGIFLAAISIAIITVSVVTPANANPVVGLREE